MTRFVTINGATYFETPDVNICDGNTGNLQQSVGLWQSASGASIGTVDLANTLNPAYGDFHGRAIVNAASKPVMRGGNGATGNGLAVAPSTQYSFSVVAAASVAADSRIWLREYNGTSDLGNSVFGTWTALSGVNWKTLTATVTTKTTTNNVEIRVGFRGAGDVNLSIGDYLYWDTAMLALGSDGTFYPSLRINGSLFEDKDPPFILVDFAGDGTPLTVGAGWAGDAYHYRRYDGADNTAPLVAGFEAEDVPYVA